MTGFVKTVSTICAKSPCICHFDFTTRKGSLFYYLFFLLPQLRTDQIGESYRTGQMSHHARKENFQKQRSTSWLFSERPRNSFTVKLIANESVRSKSLPMTTSFKKWAHVDIPNVI